MDPQSSSNAIVVTVVPATPAPERTVAGVIFGALGLAGLLFLLAIVLGAALAALRYGWLRLRPPADDHMPPVTPNVGQK